jgi:hypothetical protein
MRAAEFDPHRSNSTAGAGATLRAF